MVQTIHGRRINMTPFYELALRLFTRTQRNQIQKGLEKYPEPFNPRNWTPGELLNHALEETVDLTHYLVGLKTLLDDKDEEINQLKHELALVQGEATFYQPVGPVKVTVIPWTEQAVGKPPYADLDD
jgi:hypothetical protein